MTPSPLAKPLSVNSFHVLLALAAGDLNSYDLTRRVAVDSGGCLLLSSGSLQGTLPRLLERRYIEKRIMAASGRERSRYTLTSVGRERLEIELAYRQRTGQILARRLAAIDWC